MNEVSIIINGVRYDAVEVNAFCMSDRCDLYDDKHGCSSCPIGMEACENLIGIDGTFKKSDKKFER
jgi:hypothetical protein